MRTPWVRGIQAAIDNPNVEKVVNMKASQTAWTDGVIVNDMMRRIDEQPSGMICMFAKTQAAEEFVDEKFGPAVIATPRIARKVDVTTTRKAGNKKLFKKFDGGFIKLVGSNSPSSVKSTSAPVVYVEEPDDANTNIKGQGDTIKLLEDRTKTFENRKIIYGGTPTIKGLSAIEDAYKSSDQRKYYIPCHDCGESHVLDWDNVSYLTDADIAHEVYGRARLETARYVCPHCGSIWDDEQKNDNVQAAETTEGAGWIATAPFNGIAGFGFVSELYAPFYASRLSVLVKRYLEARHKLKQGDDTDWITFVNTCLGKPYEYENKNADAKALRERAEEYEELVVPSDALVLTAGIDVQHDRLAVILRGWGREQESWLVYWGEIAAASSVTDLNDPVWLELEKLIYEAKPHALGGMIQTKALTIDSSDGKTNDAVYTWVRKMRAKYPQVKTFAGKGASDRGTSSDREIFTAPRASIDNKNETKASKYGLKIYIVGVNRAKDLFTSRLQLTGTGPGRVHFYKGVRADYFDQITSEVKAPSRRHGGRHVWQKKAGVRNEAFDCECYSMHAGRAIRLHLYNSDRWDDIEAEIRQDDLFAPVSQETGGGLVDAGGAAVAADLWGNVQSESGGFDGWSG